MAAVGGLSAAWKGTLNVMVLAGARFSPGGRPVLSVGSPLLIPAEAAPMPDVRRCDPFHERLVAVVAPPAIPLK
jgi:hypothetical protein